MYRGRRSNSNFAGGFNQGTQNNYNNKPMQQQQQTRQVKAQATLSVTPPSTPLATPSKAIKSILKKELTVQTPKREVPQPIVEDQAESNSVKDETACEKSEAVTPMNDDSESVDQNDGIATDNESVDKAVENGNGPRKPFFKKIFGGIRKKPSVRARERKIRQNRHLRKIIIPKNALMALYEIKGIQIGDFIINTNTEGGFTALVTVNNNQYEGTGHSKSSAKANACEKAFRDYVVRKMTEKPRGQNASSSQEPMDVCSETSEVNGEEVNSNASTNENDDVPMINLASFALYKLFTAWESDGYLVPEFHGSALTSTNSAQAIADSLPFANKPSGRNELPPNWEIMHPASLLCIMRPRLTYTDCGNTGDQVNPIQTVKVIVDDQEFVGTGRSKKIARKNVAIAVCNSLFGTNFQPDE